MTETPEKSPSGFQVPADLVGADHLTMSQVRQITLIRRRAKVVQNRIDALPKKLDELTSELNFLRIREGAIKEGFPDPAVMSAEIPAPVAEPETEATG